MLRAAGLLHDRGLRAAIITNDQGGGLVDTRIATANGFEAGKSLAAVSAAVLRISSPRRRVCWRCGRR